MAKKGIDMGYYMANTEERKAMRWCINNGIKIGPYANSTIDWYIDIEIGGKINRSPYLYKKLQIWEEIFKFYKYYYNKYEKKI